MSSPSFSTLHFWFHFIFRIIGSGTNVIITFIQKQKQLRLRHFINMSTVLVAQSCPTLLPRGLQHTRLSCLSVSPRVCSDSCPSSRWCHPTISSSVIPLSSCLPSFPASVLSNESAVCMRWPKYRSVSFSISPSNEYSGLISFRIDLVWSPCSPRDSQEPFPAPQFENINSNSKNNTVFLIKYTYIMVITFIR